MIRRRPMLLPVSLALVIAVGAACSSESSDSEGTGGSTAASGGSTASGGTSATGGSVTGGTTATGGVQSSGGTGGIATGGTSSTGGTTGSGGSVTGGTTSTGGVTNTGGTTDTGGTTGMGGRTGRGGTGGRGGVGGTGGATDTGGVGGSTDTGGTTSTGGRSMGGRGGEGGSQGGVGGGDTGGVGGGNTGGTSTGGSGDTGGSSGFAPCPSTGACNVMPVGDSITEGCCWTTTSGGYRVELFRQSLTNNKNLTFVGTATPNGPTTVDGQPFPRNHEGHGGWKISQIAGIIDGAISSSKPHIVLLKIGTNDINGNDDVNNAPNRLESLMNQIIKDVPDALLVVSAVIPTTTDSKNPRMQAYNTAIQAKVEAAAAAGKHVLWVDNYKAFTDNANFKTALMGDELHPNAEGYAVLGKSFYGVISSYLPAK
jgi:lysophospholipase L1-like esterase